MRHASETPTSLSPPPLLGLLIRRRKGGVVRGEGAAQSRGQGEEAADAECAGDHARQGEEGADAEAGAAEIAGDHREIAGDHVDGIIQRVADAPSPSPAPSSSPSPSP